MFRVHDYKTEITERHTTDFFYIVILSVRSRNEKRGDKMMKERVEIATE